MEQNQALLDQALQLMFAGMGTVFGFLIILVFATKGMSWLALRVQPAAAATPGGAVDTEVSADELAAAAAAVQRYRQDH
ncbi:MAG: OadG family protein [Pseudomonadales bacterium]